MSMGKGTISDIQDPLADYQARPIISAATSPDAQYIGRVVIELWAQPQSSDAGGLAYTVDAVNSDQASLLQRAAAALTFRLASSQKTVGSLPAQPI